MYPASADFHQAIQNGNRQMVMLIFQDAVFTASDINVDAGIRSTTISARRTTLPSGRRFPTSWGSPSSTITDTWMNTNSANSKHGSA